MTLAYIDPTGGLPPSMWGAILATLAAAAATVAGLLRLWGWRLWRALRHWHSLAIVGILAGAIGVAFFFSRSADDSNTPASDSTEPRVLVLALDGLDPQLLNQYLAEGRLPHLAALAAQGVSHKLPTALVPQSPVAWCTFITGDGPTSHGVYDFLRRDPQTYLPDLSLANRQSLELSWRGTPLWKRPAVAKLGLVAQRLPMVFPPPKLNGRLLAGMGVWDVRGTEGTYFFYASTPPELPEASGIILSLEPREGSLHGELPGPYIAGQPDTLREPFQLTISAGQAGADSAMLHLQDRSFPLPRNAWSDWIEVEFRMGPLRLERVAAVTRAWLTVADDEVSLYISPLNFDPRSPRYPISQPSGYSGELVKQVGLYATRGMPFDAKAVRDSVLSDEAFLAQANELTAESERMLQFELTRFRRGVLFAYFEASDMVQHLFWRGIDPQHPLYDDPETERNRDAIPRMYEQLDALVGRAQASLGPRGTLVVMSDHGFAPYRWSLHVNSVLRDLGYLKLKDDARTGGELFADVDFTRTQAYALGFNALYLNIAGREGKGIVPPEEADALAHEIALALEAWQDPLTGERPLKAVGNLRAMPAGNGTAANNADRPDLILGYRRPWRASWQTALGATPAVTAEPNAKKWSGDHCIDASEVPGVFLSSDPRLDARSLAELGEVIDAYLADRLRDDTPAP